MSSSWAVITFLKTWHEDRLAGRSRTLEEYVARFPGRESEVAAEYERLHEALERRQQDGVSPGGRSLGRYRLLEVLGRGGQATVWRAEDERLQRTVAVKVLEPLATSSPAAALRLLREANITSRLRDPGICPIHDAGTEDGLVFFVMDLVPGSALSALVSRAASNGSAPPLVLPPSAEADERPWANVLFLVERLARAVHVAHEAGVVHRDIKPGNIMVTPEGAPVVLDFGLALDDTPGVAGITASTSSRLGTPAYMAPEQVRGDRDATGRATDVWALGVVLFECLTLTRPFAAPGLQSLYRSILEDEPSLSTAGIPPAARAVLACTLAKDPARRYVSAADFADDLRVAREGGITRARMPGMLARMMRTVRRRPALTASLSIAFVALGLWLAFAWRMLHREQILRVKAQDAVAEQERLTADAAIAAKEQRRLREAAERAGREEQTQREAAERGFNELRKLLHTMVWEVHTAIRELPGAAAARKLLLEKAAGYLQVLEDRATGDDTIKLDLASAYLKLGDVQGHPATQSFGDMAAAEKSYRRARKLATELAADPDASLGVHEKLLVIDGRMADLESSRGRLLPAMELAKQVIAAATKLRAEHPNSREVLMPLLSAHSNVAVVLSRLGQPKRAREHLEAAVGVAERVLDLEPDHLFSQTVLAGTLMNLGLGLEGEERLSEALAHVRRAHTMLTPLIERFPNNFEAHDRLTATCGPLARLLAKTGQPGPACELMEHAITDQERLVTRSNESLQAVRRLCTAYGSAIHLMREFGTRDRVRALVAKLRKRIQRLSSSPQATTSDLLLAMWGEFWIVLDALETGDAESAVTAWARAREIIGHKRLAEVMKMPILASTVASLRGHVALARGERDVAEATFTRGLSHLGTVAAQVPGLRVEMLLGRGLATFANDPESARADLETGRAELRRHQDRTERMRRQWCEVLVQRLEKRLTDQPDKAPR